MHPLQELQVEAAEEVEAEEAVEVVDKLHLWDGER